MQTFVCPKGHESSEADYCSQCGAKMEAVAAPAPATAIKQCPDCGTPREHADVVFCEICGYNFATGAHGEIPERPPVVLVPVASMPVVEPAEGWSVEVTVDAQPHQDQSPEAPSGIDVATVELKHPVSLIGRRSDARAIFPDVALTHDDAVSHRHALLQLNDAGALTLRDIGSSNGTRVNGQEIAAMVDVPLHDGDAITLGHWSRLTVHEVR